MENTTSARFGDEERQTTTPLPYNDPTQANPTRDDSAQDTPKQANPTQANSTEQPTTPLPLRHSSEQPTAPLPVQQKTTPLPSQQTSQQQKTTPLPSQQYPKQQQPPQRDLPQHTLPGATPYAHQAHFAQAYPYSPAVPQTPYGYPNGYYNYGQPYQPFQSPVVPAIPTEPAQKKTWSSALLAAFTVLALVLGLLAGAGIVFAWQGTDTYGYDEYDNSGDAIPDYGDGVFGEDGSDPFFPEGTENNSSGSRVDSAPGILIIDSMLTGGIGSGSGMVISADGYAVTNYHVVEGSTTVRVTVADTNESYTATVIGHDAAVDIALLKLDDAKDLDYVDFDTSAPKKGEKISVIGNAGGQGYLSQLKGSITAVNQDITAMTEGEGSEDLTGLIQTDADVVQGYSGGPMFNSAGKVIGVVVAAAVANGGKGDTDGYAIPAKTVMSVVDQIKTGKSKGSTIVGSNAALGVTVTSEGTDNSRISRMEGAHVVQVTRGSAAEKAGIQTGDVITEVNGEPIESASDLSKLIKTFSIGDKVKVTYTSSSGDEKTVDVTLGESPVN